jgi:hypothetical protein
MRPQIAKPERGLDAVPAEPELVLEPRCREGPAAGSGVEKRGQQEPGPERHEAHRAEEQPRQRVEQASRIHLASLPKVACAGPVATASGAWHVGRDTGMGRTAPQAAGRVGARSAHAAYA